jgi:hydrogenase nickel incorporation protein HypA/HybF
MHELSIALSILDVAAEEAERHGGGRVVAIHLRLGPFSGVAADALRSAYDLAREGTDLAKADLVIEETSLRAYCPSCAAECEPPSTQQLCCPVCGGPTSRLVHGQELEIVALEIES